MKIKDLSVLLTKVSLFKGLDPEKISKCLEKLDFKIKKYEKNETVFFRGDTLENSKLLFFDKEKYLDTIHSDKRLLFNFVTEISNKSQLLSKRIWFNFTNKTIEEKILSYIKENSENGKIKFLPSISALAKRFEVTRPALSREISNLCKKKILIKAENNVYLINFKKNVWHFFR